MSFWTFLSHEWFWVCALISLIIMLTVVEWLEHGHGLAELTLQQAIRFLNDKKHVVLDLRPLPLFEKGHVPHSKHADLDELLSHPGKFIKKKDTPILLLCEHNHRTRKVGRKLKQAGYTNIQIVQGGLAAWHKENLPLNSIPIHTDKELSNG